MKYTILSTILFCCLSLAAQTIIQPGETVTFYLDPYKLFPELKRDTMPPKTPAVLTTNPVSNTGTAYPCVRLSDYLQPVTGSITVQNGGYGPQPVLYAKIDSAIVLYHYAANEHGVYESMFPELAKGLEYIGCGYVYSFNGVVQTDSSRVQYFWRKK